MAGACPNSEQYHARKVQDRKHPRRIYTRQGSCEIFYDKLWFLRCRYNDLLKECERRGFRTKDLFPKAKELDHLPSELFGHYTPTGEALKINRQRIQERMPANAKFTTYRV